MNYMSTFYHFDNKFHGIEKIGNMMIDINIEISIVLIVL